MVYGLVIFDGYNGHKTCNVHESDFYMRTICLYTLFNTQKNDYFQARILNEGRSNNVAVLRLVLFNEYELL